MKQPLCLLCLLAVLLLAVRQYAVQDGQRERLLQAQAILTEASEESALSLTGVVADCSRISNGVRLTVSHLTFIWNSTSDTAELSPPDSEAFFDESIKIMINAKDPAAYLPGDRIRATGRFLPFQAASNPGQFDTQAYYFSSDTIGTLWDVKIKKTEEGGNCALRLLYRIRRALGDSYLGILGDREARTAAAISLGEKNWMEREWKLTYQEGGIAHIIAISGLHITMVAMTLYRMLRRLGLPFLPAALLCAAAAGAYTQMTGGGVSAVRACLMFVIWLGAQVCGRKYDTKTSAAVAAVLMLAGDARRLFQASFLLSFGAILSLALLVPLLQGANPFAAAGKRRAAPLKRKRGNAGLRLLWQAGYKGWELLAGSAGVWLGTLPVTLWFFYQTAPWSIPVNLVVVPLMSAVMASGLISGVAGLFCIPLGTFLAAPLHYLLGLFETLCLLEQKLPCAMWTAGKPAAWKVLFCYAVLAAAGLICRRQGKKKTAKKDLTALAGVFAYRKKAERRGPCAAAGRYRLLPAGIWLSAALICVGGMGFRRPGRLCAVCLDVGQGDCALLAMPDGTACLVDAGSTSEEGIWEYRVLPAIRYYGIDAIDYVFLTHDDSDHTSGIREYLKLRLQRPDAGPEVKHLVLPPTADAEDFLTLRQLAAQAGIPVLRMEAGEAVGNRRADWELACLAPCAAGLTGDQNQDSLVLLLRYRDFRMLFTGDLSGEAELALAASEAELRCDILKAGHHGSAGASSPQLLKAAAPAFAVISCGKNNRYGHPAPETLQRLKEAGIRSLATPECGAVVVLSDGFVYSAQGFGP